MPGTHPFQGWNSAIRCGALQQLHEGGRMHKFSSTSVVRHVMHRSENPTRCRECDKIGCAECISLFLAVTGS